MRTLSDFSFFFLAAGGLCVAFFDIDFSQGSFTYRLFLGVIFLLTYSSGFISGLENANQIKFSNAKQRIFVRRNP